MRIKKKFLQLTKTTIPYGMEHLLERFLPNGSKKDKFGNYFISIGENYSTMFTCHLDTASKDFVNIKHTFKDNYIQSDGTTILGADDKAGMTVLLYMINQKVPGLYYFFIGEEVGCIGSRALSADFQEKNITKVVSFDRRGTHSIITEQWMGRCCSNQFALALSKEFSKADETLQLVPDDTGVLTDSAQFIDIVNECTNISVGYYSEHTTNEKQDIEYLVKLCKACVKVDWESLPIIRNTPDDFEDLDLDLDLDFDLEFEEFPDDKIESEKVLIHNFIKNSCDYNPFEIEWDGKDCYCDLGEGQNIYIGSRDELKIYIDEL
jgi:hypothetical protein